MTTYLRHTFSSSCGDVRHGSIGRGADVVLVHGTPASSVVWDEIVERLGDRYRFHLLDLPGYGSSEMFDGQEVRLRSFARVVKEWVEHLEILDPVLVGHDFGAAAVLGAHLVEDLSVQAICVADGVVLSPWGTPFSKHVKEHRSVFAAVPPYIHEAVLRAHLSGAVNRPLAPHLMSTLIEPWTGAVGQDAYYRQVGQYDEDFTSRLEYLYPTLSVPVTILWGEHDQWVATDEGRRLQSLVPGALFETLPDAGHFSMLDTPGAFANALDRWLRSVSENRSA